MDAKKKKKNDWTERKVCSSIVAAKYSYNLFGKGGISLDMMSSKGGDPVVEIGHLSPIRYPDEGYKSFTHDFSQTPIMSTPLKGQRQSTSDLSVALDDSGLSRGDGLWESTLLEVQVKSKVVLPGSGGVKAPSPAAPVASHTFKAGRRVTPPSNKRPRVFDRPEEWQHQKDVYVESVSRHMRENPKGGAFNELLDLMNTVANEQHPWQHPSDLTTRNYQPGNVGKSLFTLDEWTHKNGGSYKRFARS
ncbi:hypothetical protein AALO_G00246930 [Alosa alosa]|uniref:S100P-binding protein n=1 Tax=Alosa alosa TaxID=278164 RepID=A0AAV6FT00_9TELE|nr:hypothetical protein AALO_G00246930 [Alosa alosa]